MPRILLLTILLILTLGLLIAAGQRVVSANPQAGNGKYDVDGDGLIEIEYLEQLNAIRFGLDGDGRADHDSGINDYVAAYPMSREEVVCDHDCKGYELSRPLDFASPDSYASGSVNGAWTTGEGWCSIGGTDGYGGRFNALFDGNRHTIAN